LFDQAFLPQGLALYDSLRRHASPFTLWILCLDISTLDALTALDLPDVRLLALSDHETEELRVARSNRGYGEYCWTLASHVFSFVFEREPAVSRLTYLDADVYFFDSTRPFFEELERAGKSVLITEHAFAPEYAHYAESRGRYCVQFVTFTRNPGALRLLAQWQAQTRESCSAAMDAALFGDQQYLDAWPVQHPDLVHVLDDRGRTLAPWNAEYYAANADRWPCVMYHFHSYRLSGSRLTVWCHGYPLRHPRVRALYAEYHAAVEQALRRLRMLDLPVRRQRVPWRGLAGLRLLRSLLLGRLWLHRHAPHFSPSDV
jgi:hypothetical protein